MKKIILLVAMGIALTTQTLFAQVPSYVPTNGLVGYWPFSGNANDGSGNGYNGIVSIPTTITEDRFGNSSSAFDFGNTSSVINVPNIGSSNFPNDYSISAWVYFRNFNNSYPYILCGGGLFFSLQGTGPVYGINQKKIAFYATTPTLQIGVLYTNNEVSIDTWHHVMIVKNSNLISLYLDGILSSSTNYPNLQLSNETGISFGNTPTAPISNDYNIDGKIDDIGIWNRALTQNEIASLYYSENSCQSLVINTGILGFNPPTYQNTVTIYPNPANDQITIDCGNLANVSGWNIKITNMLGQEVFNAPMNTQQYVVPLNSWTGQGVYFVRIYDASNNLVNTKKIILQ